MHKTLVYFRLAQILLLLLVFDAAQALESTRDRFKISLGGYVVSGYDSVMSLSNREAGIGVSIVPEDTLGLKTEQTVFHVDGYYRFSEKHALTYGWYSIGSSGNIDLERNIEWVDENYNPITITIGTNITSTLDYDIYKIGYLWSFYHSDKVELAVGTGLHITRVAVGLAASDPGINARDVKTTLPLPVVSVGLNYNVTPKFSWYLKSELFSLSFDTWNGLYTDSRFGLEYRTTDHTGVGASIGSNALKLTDETNDYRFVYDNRITGLLFYVAAYF